jgi:hypothetical protein
MAEQRLDGETTRRPISGDLVDDWVEAIDTWIRKIDRGMGGSGGADGADPVGEASSPPDSVPKAPV